MVNNSSFAKATIKTMAKAADGELVAWRTRMILMFVLG
jgi:hypothetical protein